jgi:hypothetical protein
MTDGYGAIRLQIMDDAGFNPDYSLDYLADKL